MNSDSEAELANGEQVVFLVGAPRSGTTLLQKWMCDNYLVRTLPETHFFSHLLPSLRDEIGPNEVLAPAEMSVIKRLSQARSRLRWPDQETPLRAKEVFLRVVEANISGLCSNDLVLEKTPNHARCIKQIHEFFPAARFVHIVRHPLNAVSSMCAVNRMIHRMRPRPSRRELRWFCGHWRDNVFGALGHSWCVPMSCTRYEDFVQEPARVGQRIADFLDCAARGEQRGAGDQLYHHDVEPWKAGVETAPDPGRDHVWHQRLSEREGRYVEDLVSSDLRFLGYERKTKDIRLRTRLAWRLRAIRSKWSESERNAA